MANNTDSDKPLTADKLFAGRPVTNDYDVGGDSSTDLVARLSETIPSLASIPMAVEQLGSRMIQLRSLGDDDLLIELRAGTNCVGRQRQHNHIVLLSPRVSRFHAEIHITPGEIRLRDLDSGNGTFHNGERVQEAALNAGDRIGFSDAFAFEILIDQELRPAEAITLNEADAPDVPPTIPPETVERVPASLAQHAGLAAIDRQAETVSYDELNMKPVEKAPVEVAPNQIEQPPDMPLDVGGGATLPLGGHSFSKKQNNERAAAQTKPENEPKQDRLVLLHDVNDKLTACESFSEADDIMIAVLERVVPFDRGFISYQMPDGEWKMLLSPRGDHWAGRTVRDMLLLALRSTRPVVVRDSTQDPRLGCDGEADSRLLVPLRHDGCPIGSLFLLLKRPRLLAEEDLEFLELFSDVAALGIMTSARKAAS